ncbi:MAG: ABC transporter substrate-binding protein [Acidimicrobiales bacterium]
MKAYFDWVNAHAGIGGRTIQLVTRDDGYDPATTPSALADMLATDNPFYVTTVGTPGSLAVYDQLNKGCIPQPFAVTSHPALADPVAHPWSTGLQMSYPTEAVLWGNWLKQNLGGKGPVSVGALVIDNDFGQIYADAFQQWADVQPTWSPGSRWSSTPRLSRRSPRR